MVKVEKINYKSVYVVQFLSIKQKSLYLYLYNKTCVWVVG